MNQLRFLTREKLLEYLDEEMRLFLNSRGVYEINQYGWLTDDRPDPEYLGLAIWQRHPPLPDLGPAPIGEHGSQPGPNNISATTLFKNGLEFEGSMKAARHSLGYTFLYHDSELPPGDLLNPGFLYHYTDAAMKLNLATDRLRVFFAGSFQPYAGPPVSYNDPASPAAVDDEHRLFCRPFHEARTNLERTMIFCHELDECFGDLIPLVEQTSHYRLDCLDQNRRVCLSDDGDLFGTPGTDRVLGGFSSLDGNVITRDLAEWYKLLVKTGSQVFLAEYLLRAGSDSYC